MYVTQEQLQQIIIDNRRELHLMLDIQFERLRHDFGILDDKIDALGREMNERFEKVNERFEKVNERFEKVDSDIADLKADIADLKADMADVKAEIKNIKR